MAAGCSVVWRVGARQRPFGKRTGASRGRNSFKGDDMTDEEAAAFVAAGRLLQSRDWPSGRKSIQKLPGETYPQAMARVIGTLPEDERRYLRELTSWVREYERAEANAPDR